MIYLVLRKRPQTSSETSIPATASAVATTQTTARSTAQKVISIAYLIGGAFGVITILPQLNGTSLGLLDALAYLIILTQIAAALYGGWQFWNHKPIGAQVLYWLSWSCVPVLSFSVLSYWCAMALRFSQPLHSALVIRYRFRLALWLRQPALVQPQRIRFACRG